MLVRDLANGTFVADQRNAVLIGGTGTGKSHLAIALARSLIRNGTRGRFFNVVDLVNRLETEHRGGKQGRIADYLTRLDFVVLDEFGVSALRTSRRATAVPPHQQALRTHLDHCHHQPGLRRMTRRLRRRQNDDCATRPSDASLRDHRDRKRILALQEPRLSQYHLTDPHSPGCATLTSFARRALLVALHHGGQNWALTHICCWEGQVAPINRA